MDSMCISARNEFTTSPENLVSPKYGSHADHDVSDLMEDNIFLKFHEDIKKLLDEEDYWFFSLPEEENVDLNSNDSSYTMRVSTSIPSANAVGKCSNLGLTSGFFKEAGKKTPHVAVNPLEILVEEKTEIYPGGREIIVLSSRPPAGPSIFNCSWLSDSTIPSSSNSSIPSSSNSSTVWILDSGGTGSVRLCNELTLQNVLFVPQFHWNLLSISALTQQHPYVVSFHSDHYVIEDPTQGRRIGIGRQAGNLYTLDLSQMFFVSP